MAASTYTLTPWTALVIDALVASYRHCWPLVAHKRDCSSDRLKRQSIADSVKAMSYSAIET